MNSTYEATAARSAEDLRLNQVTVEETIEKLGRLETELEELIERMRWYLYLGHDKNTTEFINKLDLHH